MNYFSQINLFKYLVYILSAMSSLKTAAKAAEWFCCKQANACQEGKSPVNILSHLRTKTHRCVNSLLLPSTEYDQHIQLTTLCYQSTLPKQTFVPFAVINIVSQSVVKINTLLAQQTKLVKAFAPFSNASGVLSAGESSDCVMVSHYHENSGIDWSLVDLKSTTLLMPVTRLLPWTVGPHKSMPT